jgi:hypothetical protein
MAKKLLNQTEFAKKMGVKRQRIGQLIIDGDLMTEIVGKRTMVLDNLFNVNVVRDRCEGSGHWNRPRSRY